jgi:RHS repeat-associated protein
LNPEAGFAGASTPNASGGFVYLRNRWYDPQTGRFLTQDPIGLAGGVNLYSYAGGNPISFSDPYGLEPDCRNPKTLYEATYCVGVRTQPLEQAVEIAWTVETLLLPMGGAGGGRIARLGLAARGANVLTRTVDAAVDAAQAVQGSAGRKIFEAARVVGESGLSQGQATRGVMQATRRLGFEIGGTIRRDGVNYVLARDARNGIIDAVAIDKAGKTSRAAFRVGEGGALELVEQSAPVVAPQ